MEGNDHQDEAIPAAAQSAIEVGYFGTFFRLSLAPRGLAAGSRVEKGYSVFFWVGVCRGVPGCVGVCRGVPGCAGVCRGVSGCAAGTLKPLPYTRHRKSTLISATKLAF